MTSNLQAYVPEDHRAMRVLWVRVVAAYKARTAQAASEYGIGYMTGWRDASAEAYSTLSGVSRQKVGERARAAARDA